MLFELKICDPRIGKEVPLPKYQSKSAAGIDLYACITEELTLSPSECVLIPSGIAMHMQDPNCCGVIAPRSGLGHKHGIILGNNVGVIDADYQGEIKISLWNRSSDPYTISPLERVAQLLILPILRPDFKVVENFSDEEDRDQGGFGSSGK